MSHVSCNGPLRSNDQSSADTSGMESNVNVVIIDEEVNEANEAKHDATGGVEQAAAANNEAEPFTKRKRKQTSTVWEHFREVTLKDGTAMHECIHCGEKVKKYSDGTTTPMKRHIDSYCPKLKAVHKGQMKLKVPLGKSASLSTPQNWKFDNARIRELIAHMILVHELPFNFVEYDLFNIMMKEANPAFTKISRATIRQDIISSYDIGRKRIQKLLNLAGRVSITTDMWTSVQNIHYMVVTCHFVDSELELQKCILNFIDIPPPYTGVRIYDFLFKCLKEWKIETKVASLTVDNAKTNDVVATKLMENLNLQNKLAIDGKLFHVRCCAHILNLLVQDGIAEIKGIIHNVRESVKHVSASPGRLHLFGELSKQLLMSKKHLFLDVSTRWNATYAMLSSALEFKEVFVNYADRESSYNTLPSADDWKKVEDVCSFLELFNVATNVISGSEYPTSNLFMVELYAIKEALDKVALDERSWMKGMDGKMKEKFDKYWGSCNLLISIGAILDPRYKMQLIDLAFNSIYCGDMVKTKIEIVEDTLEELFQEYVVAYKAKEADVGTSRSENVESGSSMSRNGSSFNSSRFGKGIKSGSAKYNLNIRSVDCVETAKSELKTYLEEGVCIPEPGEYFDALGWWKANKLKYRILYKMAADILAIPITTVASESAFSAGGRVIEPHRSALGTKMVDTLICGADWYRHYYGLHKKTKKENVDVVHVELL